MADLDGKIDNYFKFYLHILEHQPVKITDNLWKDLNIPKSTGYKIIEYWLKKNLIKNEDGSIQHRNFRSPEGIENAILENLNDLSSKKLISIIENDNLLGVVISHRNSPVNPITSALNYKFFMHPSFSRVVAWRVKRDPESEDFKKDYLVALEKIEDKLREKYHGNYFMQIFDYYFSRQGKEIPENMKELANSSFYKILQQLKK